jgi:hypothetical protein
LSYLVVMIELGFSYFLKSEETALVIYFSVSLKITISVWLLYILYYLMHRGMKSEALHRISFACSMSLPIDSRHLWRSTTSWTLAKAAKVENMKVQINDSLL